MRNKLISLLLAGACAIGCAACDNTPTDPYERYAETPVVYEKQTAEYEDSALSLWFDHAFGKTTRDTMTSTGRQTYQIYMGKNEIEDCQFFLASNEEKTVTLRVSDFASEGGATVPVSLYYQYYFTMTYGGAEREVPDAIPPVTEGTTFSIAAGTSAGFVLQAKTTADTAAGEYTATLDVLNEDGRTVKTATVFLRVWNFTLEDDTLCRTAMWIDRNTLLGMDYKVVYDYLLENRVNAYDLPYALDDARVDEYLNHPRVNSFNILGFKFNKESGKSDAQIQAAMRAAYAKLSPVDDWNRKGYFYIVDEPSPAEPNKLGWIKMYGEWLEECYPGYRQMSPFFTDQWYDSAKTQDWIEYLRPYINIWVPKTYAYTTLRQYAQIVNGVCLYKEGQEGELDARYGNYPKRIAQMVEQDGAEAWWYVTSQPTDPYITFNTTEPGVAYRVLFWQQKMNDVSGLLYWSVNYWSGDGWNNREAEWTVGSKTYGNGQLIYPGSKVGQNTPVGSLRLEAIRDGIEDYQTLSMLSSLIGAEQAQELIHRTTTHVAVWNHDQDDFASERVLLGNWLDAVTNAH